MNPGTISIPAIKGRMGSRDYYVAIFPLRMISRFFDVTSDDLPAEQRAQRRLVTKRVPEITRYLLEHEDDWVFSSLTASYDGEERFDTTGKDSGIGTLHLPFDTKFLTNDGQHRLAAIKEALRENPSLGDQSVSIVLLPEEDLDRNQQIFSDLNRTVQKTSRSLDILYDHRDPVNQVVLAVTGAVPLFHGRVDKDRVSLAARSPKFATLSALYDANAQLLGSLESKSELEMEEAEALAITYWKALSDAIPQWQQIRDNELKPAEARAEYVNAHAVAFHALGTTGRRLMKKYPDQADWSVQLGKLGAVDWSKTNPEWQGIVLLGGDVITRRQTRAAFADLLSWHLGLIDEKPERVLEEA